MNRIARVLAPAFRAATVVAAPMTVRSARLFSQSSVQFVKSTTTARASRWVAAAAGTTLVSVSLATAFAEDHNIPIHGVPGTKHERTFIAVKPDGVQRGLIGEIIQRFERRGYKLVGLKMVTPTKEMAEEHYSDLNGKPFFPGLVRFFSSGPIVAMVWEGQDVIKYGRTLLGATNPKDSQPGTIRGDLCVVVGRNVCHGSDGPEGAEHEIKLWWKENELNNWASVSDSWVYEK